MKKLLILLVVGLLLSGCSLFEEEYKMEKSSDELVSEGSSAFISGDYRTAVRAYTDLKDWYPFSSHAKEAGLKIADANFLMESYDEAIIAYNEYERMHPNDEKIPYVIYQVGLCDFDRIETIDRDATATQNAFQTFQRLEAMFPDSEYAKTAQAHIEICLRDLAAKEMDIGLFYFKSKKYEAALNRFAGVVTVYPDYDGLHQSALDYMAKCKAMLPDDDELDLEIMDSDFVPEGD